MTARRSGVSRILSGSAAAWVRIGITIVTQLALVPLYLSSWDARVFGAWLFLQATWSVISVVDLGHHEYVGYECLRLGAGDRAAISRVILSAVPIALLITLWDILVVWLLGRSGLVGKWISHSPELINQWQAALLLQTGIWLITGSVGGLIVRGLAPFGYYPRMAWWGVVYALITASVPGVAVFYGADLWHAAMALSVASVSYYLIHFVDIIRIARREGLLSARPALALGILQGAKSLWLTAMGFTEMARQQGARIVLTPLAGVKDMAAFSTMRTGANFALQGLNTVTGPIMPELMRFLAARDQHRTESAFAVVWLVLCVGLAPAVLTVQYFAPALFPLWTHGKFSFDPWLFGMFSLSVLVYALAQPAIAVTRGNNILRAQFVISAIAAATGVGGMFLLVPVNGIRGAAFALLLAEMISLSAYLFVATRWLKVHGMHWPWRPFSAAFVSVIVAASGMAALAEFSFVKRECLVTTVLLEALVGMIYWRWLPPMARERAATLTGRIMHGALHGRIVAATHQSILKSIKVK